MRTIPIALANHQALTATTLAYAIRITRPDGQVFAFTSAMEPATISGVTYSSSQGLSIPSLETSSGLSVDNLELTTLNDGSLFTKADIFSGIWRNSAFTIFVYNYANISDGIDTIFSGTFGEVTVQSGKVVAELRGLQQYLQQSIGELTSPTCRNRFGDSRCTIPTIQYTGYGTVTSVSSNQVFTSTSRLEYPDPFYSYVTLLLPFDGADDSQTFTDYSPSPNVITALGNAKNENTQFKYGTCSLFLDGTTDGLSVPDSMLELGANNFTIEMWIRPSQVASAKNVMGKHVGSYGPFQIYQSLTTLYFYASSNGTSWDVIDSLPIGNMSVDTWYHIAITREGDLFRTFMDGNLTASRIGTTAGLVNNSNPLVIGGITTALASSFHGYLDDIRITNGICRYRDNFTAPLAELPLNNTPSSVGATEVDDWYGEGVLTFLTGNNANRRQKVKTYTSGGVFTLMLPMLSNIQVGDTFSVIAGCRLRHITDCKNKFNNILNFNGEPHLPGTDALTSK